LRINLHICSPCSAHGWAVFSAPTCPLKHDGTQGSICSDGKQLQGKEGTSRETALAEDFAAKTQGSQAEILCFDCFNL